MRVCKDCKIEKEVSEYYYNKKGKLKSNSCKSCFCIMMKEYRKNNMEKIRNGRKEYYNRNKESILDKNVEYCRRNREHRNEKAKENYHKNNYKTKKSEYVINRMNNDELFKLKFNMRTLIRNAFRRAFTSKSRKTSEILGCTFEEFKIYLESKFDENMNWENQGTYWHLDHIIPISSAQTEEEVYKLNHYTNFQPLYWLDNLKKSNKING